MPKLLFVILAHDDPSSLADLVENTQHFCPTSQLVLYNSGTDSSLGRDLGLFTLPVSRRLIYAKVTPFFFDVFEWLVANQIDYDFVINLETDMLFIRHGFAEWVMQAMAGVDYIAPNLVKYISPKSRWRPYHSLRPELPDWFNFFGFRHVHGAFSPGQVFARTYVETILRDARYPELKRLLANNKSYTLQEVLLPTLPDVYHLVQRSYPDELRPINRYRPYQAVSGAKRALSIPAAYFLHPVRRESDNAARMMIRSLMRRPAL